jgi:pimeloyl-ACP methyl ester carboxylesterase
MIAKHALLAAAVVTGGVLGAGTSQASSPHSCLNGGAAECQLIDVPLDRAGSVPGVVRIYAERIGDDRRRSEALVYLAGGPGQAATPDLPQLATGIESILDRADIIAFDQRGTGRSGRLSCRGFISEVDAGTAARCAAKLGAAAGFYRTVDSVADLDRVLVAFGVQKVVLYGVSYGAKVAVQYAATHPDRVTRIVLDSPVLPEGRDALGGSTLTAAARVLRATCAGGRCRGVTPDPAVDLRRLITQWGGRRALGPLVSSRGHVGTRPISGTDLLNVILAEDFEFGSRAAIPGPLRAAVQGDLAPLTRLVHDALGRIAGAGVSPHNSAATNLATLCSETAMPWATAASPGQRRMQAAGRARALLSHPHAVFDTRVVLETFLIRVCAGWPSTISAVARIHPPDIPTLIISGEQDVRTPIEDARSLAARLPRAQLVPVAGAGHSVVGTDVSGCALRAVLVFLEGRPARKSCLGARPAAVAPVPPRQLNKVPGATPTRRLANAIALTISDTSGHLLTLTPEPHRGGGAPSRAAIGGGLRGGWVRRDGSRIELHAVEYVEDVRVSGTIDLSRPRSTLAVRAPGDRRGRVTFQRRNGEVILRTSDGIARTRAPRRAR